jgi:hypothetical protein
MKIEKFSGGYRFLAAVESPECCSQRRHAKTLNKKVRTMQMASVTMRNAWAAVFVAILCILLAIGNSKPMRKGH